MYRVHSLGPVYTMTVHTKQTVIRRKLEARLLPVVSASPKTDAKHKATFDWLDNNNNNNTNNNNTNNNNNNKSLFQANH